MIKSYDVSGSDANTDGVLVGKVKWYDAARGYGFVVPDSGGGDILVHASCIKAYGLPALVEGTLVRLRAVQGERGMQAEELLGVESEPERSIDDDPRPSEIAQSTATDGEFMPARVKWFDKLKGFGFINVFGDAEDIFIHMETLRRYGFVDLAPGEAVAVRTVAGPRGQMAADIRRWEDVLHGDDGPSLPPTSLVGEDLG